MEPDYKELYFQLYRDVEKVIRDLIEIQRDAENRYLRATDDETNPQKPV